MKTSFNKSHLLAGSAFLAILTATATHAQVVSDGTTNPSSNTAFAGKNWTNNTISASDGISNAGNTTVLHSFQTFNLNTGEHITFDAGATYTSIIARITDSQKSTIGGNVNVTAGWTGNLYLINPNGIVFTGGSTINVPGGLYVSDASSLSDGNGHTIEMTPTNVSSLVFASPESFGFVNNKDGGIAFQGSTTLPLATSFHADTDNAFALADSAGIAINSVSDHSGSLYVNAGSLSLGSAGKIYIDNNTVDGAFAAGTMQIKTTGEATIGAGGGTNAHLNANAGVKGGIGGNIKLDIGGKLTFDGVSIETESDASGGAGGTIDITAQTVASTDNGSAIRAWSSSANGGSISLKSSAGDVKNLILDAHSANQNGGSVSLDLGGSITLNPFAPEAQIDVSSGANGNGGTVDIKTKQDFTLKAGSFINASSTDGDGGKIKVDARTLTIEGAQAGVAQGTLSAFTTSKTGHKGGEISLTTSGDATLKGTASGRVWLKDYSVNSGAAGTIGGGGGTITLNVGGVLNLVDDVVLDVDADADKPGNSIGTSGDGGTISITAGSINVVNSPSLTGTTLRAWSKTGNGGDVTIRTTLANGSENIPYIDVHAVGSGKTSGNVNISANSIGLPSSGAIDAGSTGDAAGGHITLTGDTVTLQNLSSASVATHGTQTTSNAGIIEINANNLNLLGSGSGIQYLQLDARSTGTNGNGGKINVNATRNDLQGTVTLSPGAGIEAARNAATAGEGSGSGGAITIHTGKLLIQSFAHLSAPATAGGEGGTIDVLAKTVTLTGGYMDTGTYGDGNAGHIVINADTVNLSSAAHIDSATRGKGKGGSITVNANEDIVIDASAIQAITTSVGQAGDVTLTARNIRTNFGAIGSLSCDSPVTIDCAQPAKASAALGSAGLVKLSATADIDLENGSFISTLAGTQSSSAGAVVIAADGTIKIVDSNITSTTPSTIASSAPGGLSDPSGIALTAKTAIVLQGANISSKTTGVQTAGDVSVTSKGNTDIYGSSIQASGNGGATASGPAGAAGTITVHADGNLNAESTVIVTEAVNGAKRAGAIDISASKAVNITASDSSKPTTISARTTSTGTYVPPASGAAPGVKISGQTVSLTGVNGKVMGPNGRVAVTSETSSNHPAGDISILASNGSVQARHADILTQTANGGSGDGGKLAIQAVQGDILIDDALASAISTSRGTAGAMTIDAGRDLTIVNGSTLSSASSGSGKANDISITFKRSGTISGISSVDSDVSGNGQSAGNITIIAPSGDLVLSDSLTGLDSNGQPKVTASRIAANTANGANGGGVTINVQTLKVDNGGAVVAVSIPSTAAGAPKATGKGGDIKITTGSLTLQNAGYISTSAFDQGPGGSISVTADSADLHGSSYISSDTFGQKAAGTVAVTVKGTLNIDSDARISSQSGTELLTATGAGGDVSVNARNLYLSSEGSIETNSSSQSTAGNIFVVAPVIKVDGLGTQISSSNTYSGSGGQAGNITITTDPIWLLNGGKIKTDSKFGNAGAITINFTHNGLLWMEGPANLINGCTNPQDCTSGISTSSSVDSGQSGGKIDVSGAYAIVMNGGTIFAIGKDPRALVDTHGIPIIESSDHYNDIRVDGIFNGQIFDVGKSLSTNVPDFVDASRVLSGQCAGQRASGRRSQLTIKPTGPYAGSNARSVGQRGAELALACSTERF